MAAPPTETMAVPSNHIHTAKIAGENISAGMRISDETTVGGFDNTGREILVVTSEGAKSGRYIEIYTSATLGGYQVGDRLVNLPDANEFKLIGPFARGLFGSRVVFDCTGTTDTATSLRFTVWKR